MTINIQNLLRELFSYTDTSGDLTIYSGSKYVLTAVHSEFKRLETSNDPEKQRKMISLFLGGTVYAMLQDEQKYGYKIGALAIARETWKHVEPSNETGEAAWLYNISAIGNHVLANLPTALTRELYTQRRELDPNPEIIIFFPPAPQGPYFPRLAENINKFDLLIQFCIQYKDNLEVPEVEIEDLANAQQLHNTETVTSTTIRGNRALGGSELSDISNLRGRSKSDGVLNLANIYNNSSATVVRTPLIISTSSSESEDRYESQPRFFAVSSEEQESQDWDFAHPSTGMIILAACIPVIGWAYLVYVLFNAIAESCCENDEENAYRLSN